jgi:hypothetical protein
MNKFFAVVLFLLSLSISMKAQTTVEISGKVTDKKSGSPLPYASVSLKGHPIGTITNDAGEFNFFIPSTLSQDTLVISYVGYKLFAKPVSAITSPVTFTLEESVIVLNEVTISDEGAKQLMQKALAAIPNVYPKKPFLMEGFHRSWERLQFADSTNCPGTLIEAAVTILDPGYSGTKPSKLQEEIFINEIRRSALMEGWDYSGSALQNLLDKNLVKHPTTDAFVFIPSFLRFPNELVYDFDGESTIDGEKVLIIKIGIPNKQKFPAHYKVYISESDYAILRIELQGQKNNIEYNLGPWHTEIFESVYAFKRIKTVPYLTYARKKYTIRNLDVANKKVIRTEHYFRELMINQIITEDVEARAKNLNGIKSQNKSLALQAKRFNQNFWAHYNVVKENPLDKKLVAFFENTPPCGDPEKRKK